MSVSPYAYRWLRAVHNAYGHRKDFAGATIQSGRVPVLSAPTSQSGRVSVLSTSPTKTVTAPKSDTVVMYKCMGSWGWSPKPLHWRRFQVRKKFLLADSLLYRKEMFNNS